MFALTGQAAASRQDSIIVVIYWTLITSFVQAYLLTLLDVGSIDSIR